MILSLQDGGDHNATFTVVFVYIEGDPLFEHDDLSGQVSGDDLLPLAIQRIYSPLLSKRRHEGIFGVGWIAPWW